MSHQPNEVEKADQVLYEGGRLSIRRVRERLSCGGVLQGRMRTPGNMNRDF